MAAEPVVLQAPLSGVRPGGLEIHQDLAGEAVLAYAGHGPLHAGLVPRPAHARGIDHEDARLGVLEEGWD
jgi:hypothetical protein